MKRLAPIFYTLWVLFLALSVGHGQGNQLKNPGFEKGRESWNFWGGEPMSPGRSGSYSLKVSLEQPRWSGADQIIFLPDNTTRIEVSGWMKTENIVSGSNNWEKARIALEFLDANGTLAGGYPPVVGQAQGNTDWTYYENSYTVTPQMRQVKIQTVLGNCTGTAWFDDISLVIKGEGDTELQAGQLSGPMDQGKWYVMEVDPTYTGSHYVDWSSLLDAPAGKHGFAQAKNGHIQFDDGTPARFWGTNLVAADCFPEKAQADSVATRLAKMGCNLIRLHHMDAPWSKPNIFGNANSTRQLSAASLDKLDYLIAALKKKGIYIFLDLLVHRDFMASDGVVNKPPDLGGKQVGFFDEKIIELQKEYLNQLLTHKNPYTGLAYKDEPAIVASEFINEASVFTHFGGDILTEPYRQALQAKFEAAGNQGKRLSVFETDYSTYRSPVLKEKTGAPKGDVRATLKFMSQVETQYYTTMRDYARKIGVKYMLSGSNFPNPLLAYQRNNTLLDLMITNDYWDHPQIWKINNDWARINYSPIYNNSMLKNPEISNMGNIAKYRWVGKPLITTEYNICFPNEYRLEGIPMAAAYSRLQDVDGMLQFDFGSKAPGAEWMTPFGLSKMPDHLAQWVVAAPMVLRGDVKSAPSVVKDYINETQCHSLPSYSDFLDRHGYLSFVTRVGKTDSLNVPASSEIAPFAKYYNDQTKVYQSETGELTLNSKIGLLQINTPRVQGATGALNDQALEFPAIKIRIKNGWASALAISKDGKPLTESQNYYLVIVTPVKMKGQQYNDSRNGLTSEGEATLMAQVADGEIFIKTMATKVKISPLSVSGKKGAELPVVQKINGFSFRLSQGKSFVYEVELLN